VEPDEPAPRDARERRGGIRGAVQQRRRPPGLGRGGPAPAAPDRERGGDGWSSSGGSRGASGSLQPAPRGRERCGRAPRRRRRVDRVLLPRPRRRLPRRLIDPRPLRRLRGVQRGVPRGDQGRAGGLERLAEEGLPASPAVAPGGERRGDGDGEVRAPVVVVDVSSPRDGGDGAQQAREGERDAPPLSPAAAAAGGKRREAHPLGGGLDRVRPAVDADPQPQRRSSSCPGCQRPPGGVVEEQGRLPRGRAPRRDDEEAGRGGARSGGRRGPAIAPLPADNRGGLREEPLGRRPGEGVKRRLGARIEGGGGGGARGDRRGRGEGGGRRGGRRRLRFFFHFFTSAFFFLRRQVPEPPRQVGDPQRRGPPVGGEVEGELCEFFVLPPKARELL